MIFKKLLTLGALLCLGQLVAQPITLDDIFVKNRFRVKYVAGLSSTADGIHYTAMEAQPDGGMAIAKYAYATGEKVKLEYTERALQQATGDTNSTIDGYEFSADGQQLLVATNQSQVYRHSTEEDYYVIDLKTAAAVALAGMGKMRHASFSPDGSKVAFVYANNLYIKHLKEDKLSQITKDGERNKIIYGYADWVYEEEFSFDKGYQWNNDGTRLAYYRFDESAVPEFNMQQFGSEKMLYPADYRYKYPKAGEANAQVSIHLYDVAKGTTAQAELGDYEYVPRIKWTHDPNLLAVMTMPRLQNKLQIQLVHAASMSRSLMYEEEADAYIEISDDLHFTADNNQFVWRSERDGFFRLYAGNLNGQNLQAITPAGSDVHAVLALTTDRVYYTASPNSPINTAIYYTALKGGEPKAFSAAEGNHDAVFSSGASYAVVYSQTAASPLRVWLADANGKTVRTLEENTALAAEMTKAGVRAPEFFQIPAADGTPLNAWRVVPPSFDAKKKYPVLMYVYGGPGSQTVSNAMGSSYWWHQMMAQKGYVVVSVDNRGTGGRGRAFRTATYGQLGKLECDDQLAAARWLAGQSYVDAQRIGIWGWSYGGYMSSLALFKGGDQLKAAAAVAPVTNWRFYDSIYTERYMGLPASNSDGYDDNSPLSHAAKLSDAYLLMHGTGDDNVHYQNTMALSDALIRANKPFDLMVYPNQSHGIGASRHHVFSTLTRFFEENL